MAVTYNLGQLVWKITGDTTDFENKSKKTKKSVNSLKDTFLKAAAAIGAVQLGKQLIGSASDAEEIGNKFNVTFKSVKDDADEMAASLAKNFGLSSVSAQRLLSDTGDLLSGFGFTGESALDLSNQVNELAVDLASFTNYSGGAEGASAALTKALLGERESIKSLGIAITEADIKKLAEEQGIVGELDRQTKAMLTLELAVSQSKNAIGDFERSQDSFANQSRVLNARLETLQVTFGQKLLPIATDAVGVIIKLVDGFNELEESTQYAVLALIGIAGLAPAIVTLVTSLSGPTGIIALVGLLASGIIAFRDARIKAKIPELTEEFSELAEQLGIGKENLDNFVLKAEKVERRLKNLSSSLVVFEDLNTILGDIAEEFGVSKDAVLALGLASEDVSEEYREQLMLVKDQIEEETLMLGIQESQKSELEEVLNVKKDIHTETAKTTDEIKKQERLLGEARIKRAIEEEIQIWKDRGEELDEQNLAFIRINEALKVQIGDIDNSQAAWDALSVKYDGAAEKSTLVKQAIQSLLNQGFSPLAPNILTIKENFGDLILTEEDAVAIASALTEATEEQEDAVRTLWKANQDSIAVLGNHNKEVKKSIEYMEQFERQTNASINSIAKTLLNSDIFDPQSQRDAVISIISTVASAVNPILGTIVLGLDKVLSGLEDFFNETEEEAREFGESVRDLQSEIYDEQLSDYGDYVDDRIDQIDKLRDAEIQATKDVLDEELAAIDEKERQSLREIGIYEDTLEALQNKLENETDAEERAELQKEIREEEIRRFYDEQRAEREAEQAAREKAIDDQRFAEQLALQQKLIDIEDQKFALDQQIAISRIKLEKIAAIAEIGWGIGSKAKKEEIGGLYDELLAQVSASSLDTAVAISGGSATDALPENSFEAVQPSTPVFTPLENNGTTRPLQIVLNESDTINAVATTVTRAQEDNLIVIGTGDVY